MAQRKTTKKSATPKVSTNVTGAALAAMIVGIIGVVFCWLPFWGFVISATALTLGIVGLVKRAPNHGMAVAGTILGGVGVLLNIIFFIFLVILSTAWTWDGSTTPSQPYNDSQLYN